MLLNLWTIHLRKPVDGFHIRNSPSKHSVFKSINPLQEPMISIMRLYVIVGGCSNGILKTTLVESWSSGPSMSVAFRMFGSYEVLKIVNTDIQIFFLH